MIDNQKTFQIWISSLSGGAGDLFSRGLIFEEIRYYKKLDVNFVLITSYPEFISIRYASFLFTIEPFFGF